MHLQCRMKTYLIYKTSDAGKFVLMIFTCLTGNCRNVLKQLHELIRMERLDCMCCFQQCRNSVFFSKAKKIATRNSIFINLMDFSLNGSTQTFHTLNELNACRTSVQHSKVRWRAVARRSSQLKPYPLGGHSAPRCAGLWWPVLFGGKGRVPIPASVSKAFWTEL